MHKRKIAPDDVITANTISDLVLRSKTSRTTLYEQIKTGQLRARKLGRKTLILEPDYREWLSKLPVRGCVESDTAGAEGAPND